MYSLVVQYMYSTFVQWTYTAQLYNVYMYSTFEHVLYNTSVLWRYSSIRSDLQFKHVLTNKSSKCIVFSIYNSTPVHECVYYSFTCSLFVIQVQNRYLPPTGSKSPCRSTPRLAYRFSCGAGQVSRCRHSRGSRCTVGSRRTNRLLQFKLVEFSTKTPFK